MRDVSSEGRSCQGHGGPEREPKGAVPVQGGGGDRNGLPFERRPAVPVASARFSFRTWSVFYEKAPDYKAALAAFLTGSSELRPIPESSIRTLKESFVGLGA